MIFNGRLLVCECMCVRVCRGESEMSYYMTSLLHLTPPVRSHTDIMFVCSSVAIATAVSVGGRRVRGGQPQVSQSTFLCLCRSRLTSDPQPQQRDTKQLFWGRYTSPGSIALAGC